MNVYREKLLADLVQPEPQPRAPARVQEPQLPVNNMRSLRFERTARQELMPQFNPNELAPLIPTAHDEYYAYTGEGISAEGTDQLKFWAVSLFHVPVA